MLVGLAVLIHTHHIVPRGGVTVLSQLTALPGSSQAALVALQTKLKCGTNCGSCLPELKRLALGSRR